MNFLAHIFLSGHHEQVLVGNFIADSITNKQVADYPADVKKGIMLHRKIDSFTDQHLKVKESTKLLNPAHGKYAPVLLDIFYDYYLINNWERYTDEPFDDFTKRAYRILNENFNFIPPKMASKLPIMIKENWLANYGKLEGIEFTVEKVMKRVSKPEFLEASIESIFDHTEELNKNFNIFFPELQAHTQEAMKDLGIIS